MLASHAETALVRTCMTLSEPLISKITLGANIPDESQTDEAAG